jgi:hypothetical protein
LDFFILKKKPKTTLLKKKLLKFYFGFDLNPQQPFELPVLPAVSLCYAVSATLHTSDSMRIEQFPYFAPNLSASPIADALC